MVTTAMFSRVTIRLGWVYPLLKSQRRIHWVNSDLTKSQDQDTYLFSSA